MPEPTAYRSGSAAVPAPVMPPPAAGSPAPTPASTHPPASARRRPWAHAATALAAALVVLAGLAVATGPDASAQAGSSIDPAADFYSGPVAMPAANGDLVRTRPMDIAMTLPAFPGQWPGDAQRILYRSIGATGAPTAVSGAFVSSRLPWTGRGPRPLAVVAPGTNGQGDLCAPSKTLGTAVTFRPDPPGGMLGYEFYAVMALLLRGFDVVMTDYEGLGTPGVHTYMNRDAQSHAVLDAARAARHVPGGRVGPDSPVVLTGYSQGGGAVAAAVEDAPTYAPELPIVGAAAGAPPADLGAVAAHIDGTLLTGAIGYTLNSLVAAYPELGPRIGGYLTPPGRHMLDTVADQCLFDSFAGFGLQRTSALTRDGRSAAEILADDEVIESYVRRQTLGTRAPRVPVRVQANIHDDAIPAAQVDGLARNWCEKGATVDLVHDPMPEFLPGYVFNHQVPWLTGLLPVGQWLTDRVNGVPAPSTC